MFFSLIEMIVGNLIYFALHFSGGGNKYPKIFTPAEEAEAFDNYWEADTERAKIAARNHIIEHNLRLVARVAAKFCKEHPSDIEELTDVGTYGLLKSVDAYRPVHNGKPAKYSTLAARCIENEILMFLRKRKGDDMTEYLDEPIGEDKDGNTQLRSDIIPTDEDVIADIDKRTKLQKLRTYLAEVLSERELQIIIMRYGLNNRKPLAQKDVAEKFNISRSYVSRIEKAALAKLFKRYQTSDFTDGLDSGKYRKMLRDNVKKIDSKC
ncbi:MAG: sigma-70 family RNA polymerase sigma factor [Ruminococcus sp.]|jgi:RNA polymerase sporulation-specific sigma factor|nr:sigma-70 family RNA polymerase sigma factor [Ruminococcus sp.]